MRPVNAALGVGYLSGFFIATGTPAYDPLVAGLAGRSDLTVIL
jgi:hypothetical protein